MVEFRDTDMAGIMHFASFFGYMESAEHELIRSLGYSVHSLGAAASSKHTGPSEITGIPEATGTEASPDGGSISFPRVHASCDYLSPALCEQVLNISVSLARIGNKSLTYEFQFHHEQRLVATGRITCVCCLIRANAMPVPRKVPAELVEKLGRYSP
jgi:4-hydroxybenzoyl-CoA thioesterase/acyl-CoA thioester hydrolase